MNPDYQLLNLQLKGESEQTWCNGEKKWMVATQAFGQGMDYPSVWFVVHVNPMDMINFIQETGQAG